jgi:hypothetical protein
MPPTPPEFSNQDSAARGGKIGLNQLSSQACAHILLLAHYL